MNSQGTEVKVKHVQVCGINGTGNTIKEARENALDKIETMLDADYSPRLIDVCGMQLIVYRQPFGWNYKLPSNCISCGYDTREDAVRAATFHASQNAWTPAGDDTFPELNQYPEDQRFMIYWSKWQRGIIAGKAAGITDNEALRHFADEFAR